MFRLHPVTILLLFFAFAIPSDTGYFSGKIVLRNSFTDLSGKDVTEKHAAEFGHEQHYYIGPGNYKSMNDKDEWVQLYHSKSNTYYYFFGDHKARKWNAGTPSSDTKTVTHLDTTLILLGHLCKAVKIESDRGNTVYFYAPDLPFDTTGFGNHELGSWNAYIKATGGCVNLKFIATNRREGYVWTAEATSITPMKLTSADFKFPKGYQLVK